MQDIERLILQNIYGKYITVFMNRTIGAFMIVDLTDKNRKPASWVNANYTDEWFDSFIALQNVERC